MDPIKRIAAEIELDSLLQDIIDEGNGHLIKPKFKKWFYKYGTKKHPKKKDEQML